MADANKYQLDCEHCERKIQVEEDLLGSLVRCPHCENTLQIPVSPNEFQTVSPKVSSSSSPSERAGVSSDEVPSRKKQQILSEIPEPERFSPENVSLSESISRGIQICHDHLQTMIPVGIIYFLIQGMVSYLPAFLPFSAVFSILSSLFVTAPMLVGMSYVVLRAEERLEVNLGDVFQGFKRMGTAAMAQFLLGLFGILATIPGIMMLGFGMGVSEQAGDYPILTKGLIVLGIILAFVGGGIVTAIYSWTHFAIAIGYDHFWKAMEVSRKIGFANFWATLLFVGFVFIVNLGGVLVCCVGVFYTFPLTYCVGACFFRRAFGSVQDLSSLFE